MSLAGAGVGFPCYLYLRNVLMEDPLGNSEAAG